MFDRLKERLNEPMFAVPSGEVGTTRSKGSGNVEAFLSALTFDIAPTKVERYVMKVMEMN